MVPVGPPCKMVAVIGTAGGDSNAPAKRPGPVRRVIRLSRRPARANPTNTKGDFSCDRPSLKRFAHTFKKRLTTSTPT